MSYKLQILKDNPMAFWLLDETAGTTGFDSSPYNNLATYNGDIDSSYLPIVVDGTNSKNITNSTSIAYSVFNNYLQNSSATGFATYETSDNDFSIECWFKPQITLTDSVTPIFADPGSDIGIFWNYGSIIFAVQSHQISYPVINPDRAIHVVAIYTGSSIELYVDSILVATKTFDKNYFVNSTCSFRSGPTFKSDDSFLIDSVAVYRYSLNQDQITNHYNLAQSIPAIQIASPDNGQLFQIYDNGISREFEYSYPANKGWDKFNNAGLFYNSYEKSLSLIQDTSTNLSTEISDFISVPLGFDLNSSKIEWESTEGVSVYASIDNVTFIKCINGSSIPKYKLGAGSFDDSRKVYLTIKFESLNTLKYLPKIKTLSITFYNNKKIYALNGGASIGSLTGEGAHSDIAFGNKVTPILFRGSKNGIFCRQESGFNLSTGSDIQTVEFFYTPKLITFLTWSEIIDIAASTNDIINAEVNPESDITIIDLAEITTATAQNGNIIYANDGAVQYSWDTAGLVSMAGITSIFVNGIDVTEEANIANIIKPGRLHHIVIVFDQAATGDIKFNYAVSGAQESVYQNIIIYESAFTTEKSLDHFGMWIGKNTVSASDSSFSVTENSALTYGNDWIVVQTA